MRDWQFWVFIAMFWIVLGIAAPWPIAIFFFIGGIFFGVFSWFIQRLEYLNDFLERRIQRLQFAVLHQDLEDIKKLLGKKKVKK